MICPARALTLRLWNNSRDWKVLGTLAPLDLYTKEMEKQY